MATTRNLYIESHKAVGYGQEIAYVLKQSTQCPEGIIVVLDGGDTKKRVAGC